MFWLDLVAYGRRMSDAFDLRDPPFPDVAGRRKVLVTGAAGSIGSDFARRNAEAPGDRRFDLRLMVHEADAEGAVAPLRDLGEVVTGDVLDLEQTRAQCDGIDTVLHLAGNPDPGATWAQARGVNIDGTYNVMVAAKSAGCRRVVYASSIHAVSGYPKSRQVRVDTPVNPGDVYGVTKAFGEAMGRYMATQQGLSVIAVRICGFHPRENAADPDMLGLADGFVSARDLNQLLRLAINDRRLQFAILHGISDNAFNRLDVTDTAELTGYAPQDDFLAENPATADLSLRETLMRHDEGDDYAAPGVREDV